MVRGTPVLSSLGEGYPVMARVLHLSCPVLTGGEGVPCPVLVGGYPCPGQGEEYPCPSQVNPALPRRDLGLETGVPTPPPPRKGPGTGDWCTPPPTGKHYLSSYGCVREILMVHFVFQEFGCHRLILQPIHLSTLYSCPVTGSACVKHSAHG